MSDRYFVETAHHADRAVLTGPEAHHLIHVMRCRAGRRVTLFDGSGGEFAAQVERIGRSEVELAVLARRRGRSRAAAAVVLGVALPKGERQKWLVEKAVELGVGAARAAGDRPRRGPAGRAGPGAAAADGDRGLEAMRPQPADGDCLAAGLGRVCRHGRRRLFAALGPSQFTEQGHGFLSRWPNDRNRCAFALAVGPEGGFTDEEVALAVAAGWHWSISARASCA